MSEQKIYMYHMCFQMCQYSDWSKKKAQYG